MTCRSHLPLTAVVLSNPCTHFLLNLWQPEYALPHPVRLQIPPIDELLHCQEQTTCLMSATFQGVSGPRGMSLSEHRPVVGIIMGSTSDWETMRSEEHTSELQSLMRISYAVFCLKKKKKIS